MAIIFPSVESGNYTDFPGAARQVITVGGYQASNTSIMQDSGRGYTTTGEIKPDFVAPAVDVYGPGLRNNFITFTGTSAAAAMQQEPVRRSCSGRSWIRIIRSCHIHLSKHVDPRYCKPETGHIRTGVGIWDT